MDPLYNADGDAQTDVSPFVKRFRALDLQYARFVPEDPPNCVH